jgi:hypothetical protein
MPTPVKGNLSFPRMRMSWTASGESKHLDRSAFPLSSVDHTATRVLFRIFGAQKFF